MNPSSFKDRFSLGFLTSSQSDSQPSAPGSSESQNPLTSNNNQLPVGMEAVLSSISIQVLSGIRNTAGQPITLLDLARESSMRLEAIMPIVQYLANKGLIERVLEDPSGNDSYKVTPAGQDPHLTRSRIYQTR